MQLSVHSSFHIGRIAKRAAGFAVQCGHLLNAVTKLAKVVSTRSMTAKGRILGSGVFYKEISIIYFEKFAFFEIMMYLGACCV